MQAALPVATALPPAGSMRWYAWLFAPPAARDVMAALFALESELRSIANARMDHGIRHLKLQWWREEILRLEQGVPRHPLTKAILQARPEAGAAWLPLQDLLSGIELEVACATYETEAELDRYFDLADGLQRAMAAATPPRQPAEGAGRFARGLGQAVRAIEVIRDLRRDAHDGRIYLPLAWLAAEGIEHTELRAEPLGIPARNCLARLATKARGRWLLAREALAGDDAAALRGQRVYGELHLALLDRLESMQFRTGRGRVDLRPIRSLWTAWRAARQH